MSLIKNIVLIALILPIFCVGNSDTLFVKREGKFGLKPNFVFQNLNLKIEGAHGDIVTFEPGNTGAVGIAISYKWLAVSFYYGIYNETNGELEAKTTYQDIRLNFSKRRMGLDVNFQWYNGFSITEFPKLENGETVTDIQPDLELFSYGFNYYYSLNKEFSVQSIYKYNELQLKSRGSIIIGLNHNYSKLSFTKNIFPDDIVSGLGNEIENNDGVFIALIPTIGYQYNYIHNKFHISPGFSIGFGLQYQEYESVSKGVFKGVNTGLRYNFDVPIGYNGNKCYFGLLGRYDNSIFFLEKNIEIYYTLLTARIYFGIRI
jgi:hypothetical protein